MVLRDVRLSFEGSLDALSPESCDARPLLSVFMALCDLVEELGAHAASIDVHESPFSIALTEIRSDSVQYACRFIPRTGTDVSAKSAHDIGHRVLLDVPLFLAARESGPARITRRAGRLAKALVALPEGVHAYLVTKKRIDLSSIAKIEAQVPTRSQESFRAKILRAGGKLPRVQLMPFGSKRPCVLEAEQALAARAGMALYAEADVVAELERGSDGRILHGTLQRLKVLDSGDPVVLLDKWYAQAGKPWSSVKDIEQELYRGRA